MKFILVNISTPLSKISEDFLDNTALKEFAYGVKFKTAVSLNYNYILIPYIENINLEEENKENILNNINSKLIAFRGEQYPENMIFSIYAAFKSIITMNLSFQIIGTVDESDINIFYTDGSFSSKNGDCAGYSCCNLLEASTSGVYDNFLNKTFNYKSFSGKINNATNNIGELTGIKVAVENMNDKPLQLIISDSIYGIKTYREYIHTWKINGYKAYNKKEIKNKDLIINTHEKLTERGKHQIILFKWTKGHANNSFNEICDQLAKKEINL